MPSLNSGWVFHIVRNSVQTRANGKRRTVGTYQILHDGVAQNGADLSGMVAEAKDPGANHPVNNGKRIEAGWYPLATHAGGQNPPTYMTIGYRPDCVHNGARKPSLRLRNTGARQGILIHPGVNFLSSVGCFNPCTSLPNAAEMITWSGSVRRMIAIIDDLKAYLGNAFPSTNNRDIPRAHFFIEGEPLH